MSNFFIALDIPDCVGVEDRTGSGDPTVRVSGLSFEFEYLRLEDHCPTLGNMDSEIGVEDPGIANPFVTGLVKDPEVPAKGDELGGGVEENKEAVDGRTPAGNEGFLADTTCHPETGESIIPFALGDGDVIALVEGVSLISNSNTSESIESS